jgi:hypothetical protein
VIFPTLGIPNKPQHHINAGNVITAEFSSNSCDLKLALRPHGNDNVKGNAKDLEAARPSEATTASADSSMILRD